MSSLFSDMRRKADEVALEADKKIRITRKQGEINQIRKKIRQHINELGNLAYQLHRARKELPSEIANACVALDALHAEIQAKEEAIEAIRREKLPSSPPRVQTAVCQNCHRSFPATAAFCPYCGTTRVSAPAMITCVHCGNQIPAEARFCAHCGTPVPVQAPPPTKRCSNCHAELAEGALFCPECGTPVQQTAEVAPEPPPSSPTPLDNAPEPVSESKTCPECGFELPAEATFCPECGTHQEPVPENNSLVEDDLAADATLDNTILNDTISLESEPQEQIEEEETTEISTDETKSCPSCSAEIPLEAMFCPVCGVTIS